MIAAQHAQTQHGLQPAISSLSQGHLIEMVKQVTARLTAYTVRQKLKPGQRKSSIRVKTQTLVESLWYAPNQMGQQNSLVIS